VPKADFTYGRDALTPGGALPGWVVQQVRSKLLSRGLVVLPSDTCYSLAALAADDETHDLLNAVLGRGFSPLSLVFPSYLRAQEFIEIDRLSALLFERFTPGPITIVCPATDRVPRKFLTQTIASARGTIGARISDSFPEREVAASTPYPLTTVAIREPGNGAAVRDFSRALEIVEAGTGRLGIPWGAIAGEILYPNHSTVVEVNQNQVRLLREGHIPFDTVLAAVRENPIPGSATEDGG
jgi:L-threonylcarbamoyladenylate synthase